MLLIFIFGEENDFGAFRHTDVINIPIHAFFASREHTPVLLFVPVLADVLARAALAVLILAGEIVDPVIVVVVGLATERIRSPLALVFSRVVPLARTALHPTLSVDRTPPLHLRTLPRPHLLPLNLQPQLFPLLFTHTKRNLRRILAL